MVCHRDKNLLLGSILFQLNKKNGISLALKEKSWLNYDILDTYLRVYCADIYEQFGEIEIYQIEKRFPQLFVFVCCCGKCC